MSYNPLTGSTMSSVVKNLMERIISLEIKMEEILPTKEQLDKHPGLKDAYEKYLIVKALTDDDKI